MMSRVRPTYVLPAALLGLAAASLTDCTSPSTGRTVASTTATGTASPSESPALITVSFCVGSSPQHPGSTVTVHFLRGSQPFGEPRIQVPMRVSVEVPPGAFRVVVDGATQFTGSTSPGETVKGSMGQGCPN